MPVPLIPGSVIRVRPVGVLLKTDEAGGDDARRDAEQTMDMAARYARYADAERILLDDVATIPVPITAANQLGVMWANASARRLTDDPLETLREAIRIRDKKSM